MGRAILTFILTAIVGLVGVFVGSMMNLNGYLGIVLSIATIGAFIVSAIEDKRSK